MPILALEQTKSFQAVVSVPETDVIQEEAGDIVEPENEAERVKDTKKKKKKKK